MNLARTRYHSSSRVARQYPRFHIGHAEGIRGGILGSSNSKEKMLCLGQGGCGILRPAETQHDFVPPRRIAIQIQIDELSNEPIEVLGEIIYVRPHNGDESATIYFGVQFLQGHDSQMRMVAKALERLANEGRILRA